MVPTETAPAVLRERAPPGERGVGRLLLPRDAIRRSRKPRRLLRARLGPNEGDRRRRRLPREPRRVRREPRRVFFVTLRRKRRSAPPRRRRVPHLALAPLEPGDQLAHAPHGGLQRAQAPRLRESRPRAFGRPALVRQPPVPPRREGVAENLADALHAARDAPALGARHRLRAPRVAAQVRERARGGAHKLEAVAAHLHVLGDHHHGILCLEHGARRPGFVARQRLEHVVGQAQYGFVRVAPVAPAHDAQERAQGARGGCRRARAGGGARRPRERRESAAHVTHGPSAAERVGGGGGGGEPGVPRAFGGTWRTLVGNLVEAGQILGRVRDGGEFLPRVGIPIPRRGLARLARLVLRLAVRGGRHGGGGGPRKQRGGAGGASPAVVRQHPSSPGRRRGCNARVSGRWLSRDTFGATDWTFSREKMFARVFFRASPRRRAAREGLRGDRRPPEKRKLQAACPSPPRRLDRRRRSCLRGLVRDLKLQPPRLHRPRLKRQARRRAQGRGSGDGGDVVAIFVFVFVFESVATPTGGLRADATLRLRHERGGALKRGGAFGEAHAARAPLRLSRGEGLHAAHTFGLRGSLARDAQRGDVRLIRAPRGGELGGGGFPRPRLRRRRLRRAPRGRLARRGERACARRARLASLPTRDRLAPDQGADARGVAEPQESASLRRAPPRRLARHRRAPDAQVAFARDEAADVPLDRHRGGPRAYERASLDRASSDRLRRRDGGARRGEPRSRLARRDNRTAPALALHDGRSQVLVIEPVAEALERRADPRRRAVLAAARLERAAHHGGAAPALKIDCGGARLEKRAARRRAAQTRLRDERREAAVLSLLACEHAARARRDARRRAHGHAKRTPRHGATTQRLHRHDRARARRRVAAAEGAAKRSLNESRGARAALHGPARGEVLRDLEARASTSEPRHLHDARRGVLRPAAQQRAPELQQEPGHHLRVRPARVERSVPRVKRNPASQGGGLGAC